MRLAEEKGIALVLSLFLLTAMSVLGASLMFLAQTETYSSMNYRLMSQARYGAEAGIHRASNYLIYPSSYTPPTTGGADPITNYNTNVSPVTCAIGCAGIGQPVVLSASSAKASNYPNAGVQAAFLAAVAGTLDAGTPDAGKTTVAYAPYATLMSMQQIEVFGGGVQTLQTWEITSTGSITAGKIASTGSITLGKTAEVEVSAMLETPKFPATTFGAFGTSPTCGALKFGGNTQSNSYDSGAALVGGIPAISNSGGNVGTNGNMTESGSADIYGTLSSPRVGIGGCSAGNVDALSSSGSATINGHSPPQDGDVLQLPQAIVMPTPAVPSGVPTDTFDGKNQTLLNGASKGNVGCHTGTLTLGSVGGTATININSLTLTGNCTLEILGSVILNVVGAPGLATPFDTTGGSILNQSATFDASTFQVQYAGTGAFKLTGNSKAVGMIYAPNAAITITGNNDFYGTIIGSTVETTGSSAIHFDRRLASSFFRVGNPMMSAFNWKKY